MGVTPKRDTSRGNPGGITGWSEEVLETLAEIHIVLKYIFKWKIHTQTSQNTRASRTWFLHATLYSRKKKGGRLPDIQLHGSYNFLRLNIGKLWHIKCSSLQGNLNTNAHNSDILNSMVFKNQHHLHLCACNWVLADTLIIKNVHDAFSMHFVGTVFMINWMHLALFSTTAALI